MVAVQTTYTQYQKVAQVGQPASMSGWDIDTKICDESDGIASGLAVSQSSNAVDRGIFLGGAAFVGITAVDVTNLNSTAADAYQLGDNVPVLVEGDIWVIAENGSKAGEEVLYDPTTGKLGHNGGTVIDGARWMTSASAAGLAVCRLANAAGNASGVTS